MTTFIYFITFYVIFTTLIGIGYTINVEDKINNKFIRVIVYFIFNLLLAWLFIPFVLGRLIDKQLND